MTGGYAANISAADLKRLLEGPDAERVVLVDVRSPQEYSSGHIPGSRLVPLPELDSVLDTLDSSRPHVFCCHSGVRSLRAAFMAAAAGVPSYNLRGGIVEWRGDTSVGQPDLSVFADVQAPADALRRAAALERATLALYEGLATHYAGTSLAQTFRALAEAERSHAAHLPEQGQEEHHGVPPATLESGGKLEQVMSRVLAARLSMPVEALELALAMEYAALDLYENLATHTESADLRRIFSELARSERHHVAALLPSFGPAAV